MVTGPMFSFTGPLKWIQEMEDIEHYLARIHPRAELVHVYGELARQLELALGPVPPFVLTKDQRQILPTLTPVMIAERLFDPTLKPSLLRALIWRRLYIGCLSPLHPCGFTRLRFESDACWAPVYIKVDNSSLWGDPKDIVPILFMYMNSMSPSPSIKVSGQMHESQPLRLGPQKIFTPPSKEPNLSCSQIGNRKASAEPVPTSQTHQVDFPENKETASAQSVITLIDYSHNIKISQSTEESDMICGIFNKKGKEKSEPDMAPAVQGPGMSSEDEQNTLTVQKESAVASEKSPAGSNASPVDTPPSAEPKAPPHLRAIFSTRQRYIEGLAEWAMGIDITSHPRFLSQQKELNRIEKEAREAQDRMRNIIEQFKSMDNRTNELEIVKHERDAMIRERDAIREELTLLRDSLRHTIQQLQRHGIPVPMDLSYPLLDHLGPSDPRPNQRNRDLINTGGAARSAVDLPREIRFGISQFSLNSAISGQSDQEPSSAPARQDEPSRSMPQRRNRDNPCP